MARRWWPGGIPDESLGSLGSQRRPIVLSGANSGRQLVRADIFHQITECACLECLLDQIVHRERRERDDAGRRAALTDSTSGYRAVHARHDHVHKHDIRLDALAQPDSFFAASGFADQLEVACGTQDRRQAAADNLVVVNDQHAWVVAG
jgi:hypothetical protein